MNQPPLPPRSTAVDACYERIRDQILRGEFAADAHLPPERNLAEALGVNRTTLRAALHRLEDVGLLAPRQGSGHRVRSAIEAGSPTLAPAMLAAADPEGRLHLVRDILRIRRHLAAAVLEALSEARRPTVAPIKATVAAFRAAVLRSEPPAVLVGLDADIARAMVDATGSAALRLFLNPVLDTFAQIPELRDAVYRDPHSNAIAYELLVEWLGKRERSLIPAVLEALRIRDEDTLHAFGGPR